MAGVESPRRRVYPPYYPPHLTALWLRTYHVWMLLTLHVVESFGHSSRGGTACGNAKRWCRSPRGPKMDAVWHKTPSLQQPLASEGPHGPPALFRGNGINSPESKSVLHIKTRTEFALVVEKMPKIIGLPPNAFSCQFPPRNINVVFHGKAPHPIRDPPPPPGVGWAP